jgi:hypothetical protein
MEQNIQTEIQNLLGNWGWLFLATCMAFLFRSTIEGLVESFKIFAGKGINADDCIYIWIEGEKKAGRVVRCGLFKTVITIYSVSQTSDGEPYIEGGEKLEIQNSKLKDFIFTKPLDRIDLSSWSNGFDSSKTGHKHIKNEF